jgi:hypothetical protein
MQTSICVSNISLNILKFLNFLMIRPNPTWSDLIRIGLAIRSDFYTWYQLQNETKSDY